MKLTKIETFIVKTPPPPLGGKYFYFVKLSTDNGIYGWGETATLSVYYPLLNSYRTLMQEIFDAYLLGQDPMDRERLNKVLYTGLTARHSEYSTGGLISAIDLALWDIAGKACNQPVYNLLGGKMRDKIRSYSYIYPPDDVVIAYNEGKISSSEYTSPRLLSESAQRMVEEGFTGLKFDPVPRFDNIAVKMSGFAQPNVPNPHYTNPFNMSLEDYRYCDNLVSAIRTAVGDKADVMIGTHGQITTQSAIRLAKMLEPYDPLWLEEPVPPENMKEMAKVAKSTTIPVATGERLSTVFDFTHLLEEGAASILQPDMGSCGGITECKKISSIAEGYYAQMAPHIWGGPVITAAALQIDACIPNFLIQESIGTGGRFFNELLTEPLVWENGYYNVPTVPGLGIDLNMDVLLRHKA